MLSHANRSVSFSLSISPLYYIRSSQTVVQPGVQLTPSHASRVTRKQRSPHGLHPDRSIFMVCAPYLRLSGSLALVAGVILLFLPGATLPPAMVTAGYPLWPLRLVAALLLTLGIFFLLAANRRVIDAPTMVACTVANGSVPWFWSSRTCNRSSPHFRSSVAASSSWSASSASCAPSRPCATCAPNCARNSAPLLQLRDRTRLSRCTSSTCCHGKVATPACD